jgi:hypothetical protein
MMDERFRLEVAGDGTAHIWIGHKRYPVVQHEVKDIDYGHGVVTQRRRAYIDLDSQWSLGLLWSAGSFSDNATERIAERGGVFIEEPETVEVAALQYGALVVGDTMPFAEPVLVRAMACELEMLHEDGPPPRWTQIELRDEDDESLGRVRARPDEGVGGGNVSSSDASGEDVEGSSPHPTPREDA